VKSILVAAADADAATDFIRLTDFRLEACKGCFKCLTGARRCPTGDDLYQLIGRFQQADAAVVAVPVYFLAPTAVLLSLLDRLLTMGALKDRRNDKRRAVTLTIMGNRKWRGVAEPVINMTVSLLGFEIADSMSLVAEGPGEVLSLNAAESRFAEIGRALALGEEIEASQRRGACPVCWSDYFRIEGDKVVCPVCGSTGNLDAYSKEGTRALTGSEARWGVQWLDAHIEAWVAPSVKRYRTKLKPVLANLGRLRRKYVSQQERGEADV
jgi:multimeric flavodoxin WrbA